MTLANDEKLFVVIRHIKQEGDRKCRIKRDSYRAPKPTMGSPEWSAHITSNPFGTEIVQDCPKALPVQEKQEQAP